MSQWKAKSWSHEPFTKYLWITKILQEGKSNSRTGQTAKLTTRFTDSKMQSAQLGEECICMWEQNHSKITDSMFFLWNKLRHFAHCCCMSTDSSAVWFTVSYRSSGCILVSSITPVFPNIPPFPCYENVFQVFRVACPAGNSAALISSYPALIRVFFLSLLIILRVRMAHTEVWRDSACMLAGTQEKPCWQEHQKRDFFAVLAYALCILLYTAWAYAGIWVIL